MSPKVVLIIIYNHNFEKNIERCENLYAERFSCIFHLMPFYTGKKPNVISVYENSYFFQGYVAQGFKNFQGTEYDHYFFIADDMLLNPEINQNNYHSLLNLDNETSFIPFLGSMPANKQYWSHNIDGLKYNPNLKGCEVKKFIPTPITIREKFTKYGITNGKFSFKQVYGKPSLLALYKWLRDKINGTYNTKLNYPLARSYSDIFIISNKSMNDFVTYCGAFAASELFVELAIPTAMIVACNRIVTQNDIKFSGRALWTPSDFEILKPYNNSISNLIKNFPKTYLFLHPIKLSQWD